jgi:hypothetical protein
MGKGSSSSEAFSPERRRRKDDIRFSLRKGKQDMS